MLSPSYHRKRPVLEQAWVEWLPAIRWQLFCTAQFPLEVGAPAADRAFEVFLDRLEKRLRGRVGCFSARESTSKSTGEYVGQHIHFVLIGEKHIPVEYMEEGWSAVADSERELKGHNMKAVPFSGEQGLKYIVKMSHEDAGELPVSRGLEYFDPDHELKAYGSHQLRRHIKRFKKRQLLKRSPEKTGSEMPPEHDAGVESDRLAPVAVSKNPEPGEPLDTAALDEGTGLPGELVHGEVLRASKPDLDLDDEEIFLIDARRAYAQASRILLQSRKSPAVASKLAEYGWSDDVLYQIGIGSVESYKDYLDKMTKVHGHSLEFLKKIDLDRKGIFDSNNLIYTIRDEHGSPVGFSARNLDFEFQVAEFRDSEAAIKNNASLSPTIRDEKLASLFKPRKYVNSKETVLFKKGSVLFNFDQARKSSLRTISVFEGNADAVTLFAGGVKTATATCGTAFTEEHLDLVLAAGIIKIVLVYDPDKAGEKGTERFIAMLEQFGGRPGLEVEIIAMPGISDPDAFVRAYGPDLKVGVAEFRKLPRTDLFSWKLKKAIEEGADPYQIAADNLPLIVNIESNLLRLQKADKLAEGTGLAREFVQRELLRLLDSNEAEAAEAQNAIAQQTVEALQQNPKAIDLILANAATKLESVAGSKVGLDPRTNLAAAHATFEKFETSTDLFQLVTGYPIFDALMGGIPKEGVMISLPGKPHHGKSIWLDNLVVRMLEHNPNAQVFLHHVDDAALLRIPRLLGVMSGLSSRDISNAGSSLEMLGPEFEDRFRAAQKKFLDWIKDERLVLADQSVLANDLTAHERWIKDLRRRYPKRNLVAMGDNFHLFDLPGALADEAKVRAMSKFIAGLPVRHGITSMFTMELPKEILRPGVRPKYTDSKGSGGIAFDSKVNMGVFQEMQDLEGESKLIWHSPDHMEEFTLSDGSSGVREKDLPIVEIIVDKNKVTGVKKIVFFRLEPMSGRMEECSPAEQSRLQTTMEAPGSERREIRKQRKPSDPQRPF